MVSLFKRPDSGRTSVLHQPLTPTTSESTAMSHSRALSVKYEETRRIQFHIIAVQGVTYKLPKKAPKGFNPFVSVEGPDFKDATKTSVSKSRKDMSWHENLPVVPLKLTSRISFAVKYRTGLPLISGTSSTVGTTETYSLSQLLEMQGKIDRETNVELDVTTSSKTDTRAFITINIREIQTKERTEELALQSASAVEKRPSEEFKIMPKQELGKMRETLTPITNAMPTTA